MRHTFLVVDVSGIVARDHSKMPVILMAGISVRVSKLHFFDAYKVEVEDAPVG